LQRFNTSISPKILGYFIWEGSFEKNFVYAESSPSPDRVASIIGAVLTPSAQSLPLFKTDRVEKCNYVILENARNCNFTMGTPIFNIAFLQDFQCFKVRNKTFCVSTFISGKERPSAMEIKVSKK